MFCIFFCKEVGVFQVYLAWALGLFQYLDILIVYVFVRLFFVLFI